MRHAGGVGRPIGRLSLALIAAPVDGRVCQQAASGALLSEVTGPNPTDRGKAGTKYHPLVDDQGMPLAACVSAANVHDSQLLEPLVDAVPPIWRPVGETGGPRRRPAKLHADKGYDYPVLRRALRRRGIIPRIARRGVESSDRLGRHRWKVERTISWVLCFRRLTVRYDRHAASVLAFLHLACALSASASFTVPRPHRAAAAAAHRTDAHAAARGGACNGRRWAW